MIKNKFTVTSDGIFTGYAYVFNLPAIRDELILPGAFLKSIEEGNIKLLWDHNESEPIGSLLEAKEDKKGLFIRGQLNLNVERAREIKSLMDQGALNGLSIGFTSIDSEMIDGIAYTSLVKLWEISIVTFPAMEEALVDKKTTHNLSDAVALNSLRKTKDGYLTAFARVARTGIQMYRGDEMGRPDLEWVKVYRPENEVFSNDARKTYAHRPVTNDHPAVAVDSSNWSEFAIGQTGGDVMRDGDFVRVPLVLMDGVAIQDVEQGKRELSMGYTADIEWKKGVTKDGDEYDAIQTGIRANHLAVVDAARGGPSLRLGDTDIHKEKNMSGEKTLKSVLIDGVPVEMTDLAAQMHDREMKKLSDALTAEKAARDKADTSLSSVQKELSDAQTSAKTSIDAKDAEIATLKKQLEDATLTPDKIDKLVTDRASVVAKAKILIGDKLVAENKTIQQIQRQVVDEKMGDTAKNWNEDQIASSFNTLAASVKEGDVQDSLADAISYREPGNAGDKRNAAYDARAKRMTDAWKTKLPVSAAQ